MTTNTEYVLWDRDAAQVSWYSSDLEECRQKVCEFAATYGEIPWLDLSIHAPDGVTTLTGDELLRWAHADTEGEGP